MQVSLYELRKLRPPARGPDGQGRGARRPCSRDRHCAMRGWGRAVAAEAAPTRVCPRSGPAC